MKIIIRILSYVFSYISLDFVIYVLARAIAIFVNYYHKNSKIVPYEPSIVKV